ncbi:MAG: exo-alpha-sialidase, partial [Melioribacteraceae bacterium]|nr:exo-alpha-sialidase [Melioribacteraceae bacterium]
MKTLKYPVINTLIVLSLFCFFATQSFAQEKGTSHLVDSIKSASNFNPKYEKIKSRVSYVPGIKVIRGETQVIVPEHESFCPAGSVFKYNNGDIHVSNRRSKDGGNTWQQVENSLENSTYQYPEPDGEVIMFRSQNAGGGSTSAGR